MRHNCVWQNVVAAAVIAAVVTSPVFAALPSQGGTDSGAATRNGFLSLVASMLIPVVVALVLCIVFVRWRRQTESKLRPELSDREADLKGIAQVIANLQARWEALRGDPKAPNEYRDRSKLLMEQSLLKIETQSNHSK